MARVGGRRVTPSRHTLRGLVLCFGMLACVEEPTVATMPTASNVLEQPKPPGTSPASRCGTVFTFTTRRLARHRSQAPEDVRACGFRVPAVLFTLSAAYDASLRWGRRSNSVTLTVTKIVS